MNIFGAEEGLQINSAIIIFFSLKETARSKLKVNLGSSYFHLLPGIAEVLLASRTTLVGKQESKDQPTQYHTRRMHLITWFEIHQRLLSFPRLPGKLSSFSQ